VTIVFLGCAELGRVHNIRKPMTARLVDRTHPLKLMTFNIRAGGGRDDPGLYPHLVRSSKEKLQRIASAIKSVEPDIIALQEVRGYNQAKFIAETLNLNFSYVTHSNWWGLAILSKFRILEVSTKMINYGYDPRVGQLCTIDINGKPITVVNVHFSYTELDYKIYNRQVSKTMKLLESIREPVVLIGDLNLTESEKPIIPIRKRLIDTCRAVDTKTSRQALNYGTFLSGQGKRIDYIFIDPRSFDVVDAGVVPVKHWVASDHIAYFADMIFKD
jgi:endonuclease/exonuclease/phosphatase family metal-dependent hydrolase